MAILRTIMNDSESLFKIRIFREFTAYWMNLNIWHLSPKTLGRSTGAMSNQMRNLKKARICSLKISLKCKGWSKTYYTIIVLKETVWIETLMIEDTANTDRSLGKQPIGWHALIFRIKHYHIIWHCILKWHSNVYSLWYYRDR